MVTMEQLRKYRFFNLTLIDLIPTLFIGLIIHSYIWLNPLELDIKEQSNRTFIQYILSLSIILVTLLGLGIIIHRSFSINSALSAHLGLNGIPNKNNLIM